MLIFNQVEEIRPYLDLQKKSGKTVGFVPTMGALHEGHLSLVRAAAGAADQVVCSIFVNPTQFTDQTDFERYPSSPGKDLAALEKVHADIAFLPPVADIYPEGLSGLPSFRLGYLDTVLEGKFRPGHFQGVARAVERLTGIVRPEFLFLGQKDYQQCLIIRDLARLLPVKFRIIICPTLREPDGLAMSSRNRRLEAPERNKAPAIFRALQYVRDHLESFPLAELKTRATELMTRSGFEVDYLELALAESLQIPEKLPPGQPLVALAAGKIGGVRLIDNLLLDPDGLDWLNSF